MNPRGANGGYPCSGPGRCVMPGDTMYRKPSMPDCGCGDKPSMPDCGCGNKPSMPDCGCGNKPSMPDCGCGNKPSMPDCGCGNKPSMPDCGCKEMPMESDCGCASIPRRNNCRCGDPNEHMRHMPVGMGYVPMQKWEEMYDPATALCQGTAFPSLNLIFCGKRG